MKNTLKAEGIGYLAFSVYFFIQLDWQWYWYLIFILTPDIGILGYLINNKIGAFTYNLFHHMGVAFAVLILGSYLENPEIVFAGLILIGHSGMDRIFGYGLKYADHFKHTHLGWIGRSDHEKVMKD